MTKDNIFNKGYQYLLYMKNLNLQQIIDFYKSFSSPTKERRMRFYIENTGLQKNNLPEIEDKKTPSTADDILRKIQENLLKKQERHEQDSKM